MREPGKAILFGFFLAIPLTVAFAQGSEKPRFRTHNVPFQKPQLNVDVSSSLAGAAFKNETGILVVGNSDGLHYSIGLAGKDIKGANDGSALLFLVDSIFFQVKTVPVEQFWGSAPYSDPSTVLRTHRNWEADYLRDGPQKVGELFTEEIQLKDGPLVLFWSIAVVPGGGTKVTNRLFVTRLQGKSLLVLASAASGESEYSRARQLLIGAMTHVKFSGKRIDPKVVQEKLRSNQEVTLD